MVKSHPEGMFLDFGLKEKILDGCTGSISIVQYIVMLKGETSVSGGFSTYMRGYRIAIPMWMTGGNYDSFSCNENKSNYSGLY